MAFLPLFPFNSRKHIEIRASGASNEGSHYARQSENTFEKKNKDVNIDYTLVGREKIETLIITISVS